MISLAAMIAGSGLALTVSTADTSAADDVELWAGHQITYGSRDIPFKGEVTTRTDTLVLARVTRRSNGLVLEQKACRVDFKPVGGVAVRMRADRLPTNEFRFSGVPGRSYSGSSTVRWHREDVDRDGYPGATVVVDAPVCSGDLYVSNASQTRAKAAFDPSGISFKGRARVSIHQEILDADGACLSVVAKDTRETVQGPFAYVPVPAGSTCEGLLRRGWPVNAAEDA